MAATNYDEVQHSAGNVVTDWNSLDPLYKWDPHFPERLSRLSVTSEITGSGTPQRRQKRGRNRNTSRFKTQPITFDEIKEVDEEPRSSGTEAPKEGLKCQFAAFSRSMDGLVPGFPVLPPCLRKSRAAEQRGASRSAATTTAALAAATSFPPPANGTDQPTEPEAAAAASAEQTAKQAQEEEAAVFAAVGLNPTLAQVQDISRARRKKRRSRKSIEEEPELEKIAAVDSQSAG